jgi:ATP-dependent DNA ligase
MKQQYWRQDCGRYRLLLESPMPYAYKGMDAYAVSPFSELEMSGYNELKFDGYRMLCHLDHGVVRFCGYWRTS